MVSALYLRASIHTKVTLTSFILPAIPIKDLSSLQITESVKLVDDTVAQVLPFHRLRYQPVPVKQFCVLFKCADWSQVLCQTNLPIRVDIIHKPSWRYDGLLNDAK